MTFRKLQFNIMINEDKAKKNGLQSEVKEAVEALLEKSPEDVLKSQFDGAPKYSVVEGHFIPDEVKEASND